MRNPFNNGLCCTCGYKFSPGECSHIFCTEKYRFDFCPSCNDKYIERIQVFADNKEQDIMRYIAFLKNEEEPSKEPYEEHMKEDGE